MQKRKVAKRNIPAMIGSDDLNIFRLIYKPEVMLAMQKG
jgi:hypothetical protein